MKLDKVYDKSICSLVNFLYLLPSVPVDLRYAQHKITVVNFMDPKLKWPKFPYNVSIIAHCSKVFCSVDGIQWIYQ